jgi:hypothetical protein
LASSYFGFILFLVSSISILIAPFNINRRTIYSLPGIKGKKDCRKSLGRDTDGNTIGKGDNIIITEGPHSVCRDFK